MLVAFIPACAPEGRGGGSSRSSWEDPIFPIEWRTPAGEGMHRSEPRGTNWRFRVPDGEFIVFHDGNYCAITRMASRYFGDFLIWNRDDRPAYELAVVVDDLAMGVTEVVAERTF